MSELLSYCQLAQRVGWSRNKALRFYRAQGYRIQTKRFVAVWNAANAARQLADSEGVRKPE